MTTQYATGKHSKSICDRCGFEIPYRDLSYQIFDQKNTQIKVCRECLDEDQPQLQIGRYPINDPQALFQARPDTGIYGPPTTNSRYLFSWRPVAANFFPISVLIGQVTASSS